MFISAFLFSHFATSVSITLFVLLVSIFCCFLVLLSSLFCLSVVFVVFSICFFDVCCCRCSYFPCFSCVCVCTMCFRCCMFEFMFRVRLIRFSISPVFSSFCLSGLCKHMQVYLCQVYHCRSETCSPCGVPISHARRTRHRMLSADSSQCPIRHDPSLNPHMLETLEHRSACGCAEHSMSKTQNAHVPKLSPSPNQYGHILLVLASLRVSNVRLECMAIA